MREKIGLVWIRDDFRINKNLALSNATHKHKEVVAFFVYKKNKYIDKEAQKWWLYNSLKNFKNVLEKFNINFQIIESESYKAFFEKILKKKNFSIYWNRVYEPNYIKFDTELMLKLKSQGINFSISKGNILNEFSEIKKNDGTPFKVFTPFWRNAEKFYNEKIPKLYKNLKKQKSKLNFFENEMDTKKILPNRKWFEKFDDQWIPSESTALKKLKIFLRENLEKYPSERNIPSIEGTSKLSPFIKHGQIHVETIWSEVHNLKKNNKNSAEKFLAEIGWREFSHSMINHFPHMLKKNYSKKFDNFPWQKNLNFLKKWKEGKTGYPIVDAGMRELFRTGWMHNRVRMIVGSFLVKHLLIDWREGEKHFRNCLLDFSEANNVSGWQWVAGCGADAAPYFRIFNPILQGEKFDKAGLYIKKWVSELKNVPKKFIHKPWEFKNSLIFKIGKDYPEPIVIHEKAREKALNAFKKIK